MSDKKPVKKTKQTVHKNTNVAIKKGLAKAAQHNPDADNHDDCEFC